MGRTVHIKIDGNGKPITLVDWEGLTFADLKRATPQCSYDNCRVVVRGAQTDLVDDGALIPLEGEVFIFVVPQKMKAGALGYNEMKAIAKDAIARSGELAKEHFGQYQNLKSEVLAELVNSWNSSSVAAVSTSSSSTVGETSEMADVVAALDNVQNALNVLGSVLLSKGSSLVGGVELTQLNEEYETLRKKTVKG
jgi:hypothetical protein